MEGHGRSWKVIKSHGTSWKVRSWWPNITWRCLETFRNYSCWLRLAQYFMYIRDMKSFSGWNNLNYLVYFNRLWKPGRLARFSQFWTDIFKNPSHSQTIDSILTKPTKEQLSLYYRIDFATWRNDRPVYRSLDAEYDRLIRQYDSD